MGKGSKERIVSTEPMQTLQGACKKTLASGRHVATQGAQYGLTCCSRIAKAALNPHAIRHTFATNLRKQGRVPPLQRCLGMPTSKPEKYINMAEIPTTHKGISLTQKHKRMTKKLEDSERVRKVLPRGQRGQRMFNFLVTWTTGNGAAAAQQRQVHQRAIRIYA